MVHTRVKQSDFCRRRTKTRKEEEEEPERGSKRGATDLATDSTKE